MFRRARFAVLFGVIFLVILRYYTTTRHSILDVTEGKTSGPWREEWGHPIKTKQSKGANDTVHDESDEYVNYLRVLHRKHGFTNDVPVATRRIKAKYSKPPLKARPSLAQVKNPLFKDPLGFTRARLDSDNIWLPAHAEIPPLSLPIARTGPRPSSIDASSLLFGISTTYARLTYANNALLSDWAAWLTDGRGSSNGAGLVLTLHGATESQVKTIRDELHHLGIDVTLTASAEGETDAGGRYAQLVQQMMRQRHREPDRKWFALVDDDVFFPCMGRLLSRLQKFDTSETHYVGVPSERADWVIDHGTAITYGGAAIFMTAPMLDTSGQLLCLQYTKTSGQTGLADEEDPGVGMAWDEGLSECLARNTPDIKMDVLPGLFSPTTANAQTNIDDVQRGGGYASGALPLALHRYRNYHRFEAGKGHAVTSACGEDCFLQRFLFKDGWVLVNGYTLTRYDGGVTAEKVTVQTPKKKSGGADSKGAVKPSERLRIVDAEDVNPKERYALSWKGKKKTWRLLDARVKENGEVWQAYVNRRGGGNTVGGDMDDRRPGDIVHHAEEEKSDVDSVILLIWEGEGEK
ncbi:hypothetical protein B0T16DRAFT_415564 [Cercophora newfieldiana]|uniref:Glycosyltransferase family 31 protein n=1 Tax=Cercophora newfieldiana TaxID=92897 RepID=A0AA39Y2C3_9PEZI|nr:hypothetical protein B0T16DRAFT_415564 [Cercophora newfieldiana]